MTYEEAREEIVEAYCKTDSVCPYRKGIDCDTICSYGKAIKALEKQIPKKVEWTEDYTWGKRTDQPVCPVCDYYLTMHHFIGDGKKVSYCDTCGQAIDWSE